MLHTPTNYSPRQLLESARRAEAEGKIDIAGHRYRHVADGFANTPEGAEAYASLVRLGYAAPEAPQHYGPGHAAPPTQGGWGQAAPAQLQVPAPGGHPHDAQGYHAAPAPGYHTAPPPAAPPGYSGYMQTPVQTVAANFAPNTRPQPARREARPRPATRPSYRTARVIAALVFSAGWALIAAGLLSPVPALLGLLGVSPGPVGVAVAAAALTGGGLLTVLGGQAAIAVFDQADAMRELVEIERAKWERD